MMIRIKVPAEIEYQIQACNQALGKRCEECRHNDTCKEYNLTRKIKEIENEYNKKEQK